MRIASIDILREIGVDTGGSNVQFAINPKNGDMVVIEMNPRVSRSSALASKATGFPIAKIAALLAVGYTLDELKNDITKITPASFEPTIDYVVTKIPRFAFEKFPGSVPNLSSSMKSVGEAMAIGKNFKESVQKALRSLETGLNGFSSIAGTNDIEKIEKELKKTSPDRLLYLADALRAGISPERVHELTFYDPWFIDQINEIIEIENQLVTKGMPTDKENIIWLKTQGFSDNRLAELTDCSENDIRKLRDNFNIKPVFKRVDTCAAEFKSETAYMYSTYGDSIFSETLSCESKPSDNDKVIIIGGGPNRIGQGIEFDYCCVHASYALKESGVESIMVNCNPETVSTDYDTSDRLYFEPLNFEDLIEIINIEKSSGNLLGIIVQFGGQTPLKLAKELEKNNIEIKILGTSQDAIDLAEDRDRFQKLISDLNILQPRNGIATSSDEAINIVNDIGYPVVIRPSYVLGGRAMEIVHSDEQLEKYMKEAVIVSGDNPVLIDSYLRDAIEVDIDALCDGDDIYIAGILEHIEEAGVHSGDSACSIPPFSLKKEILKELESQVKLLAQGLNVIGLMNTQFAIKGDKIFILEVNPRASRTVPFIAKVLGKPLAKIATKIMLGSKINTMNLEEANINHFAIKEAVFPFKRFTGVDTILGPEMRSTGEVMGIDKDFGMAFAKSQIGSGSKIPTGGSVFVSVKDADKDKILRPVSELISLGFEIYATDGTAEFFNKNNIKAKKINKVLQGSPHIVEMISEKKISLVFNTTETPQAIKDSKSIRRSALESETPYYTTVSGANAAVLAIKAIKNSEMTVKTIQSFGESLN
jgi:carbamoyl-phosphate synthase large subunit